MDIYFSWPACVKCPQCGREKSVYFLPKKIMCFLCSYSKDRQFPVPDPDEFFNAAPVHIPLASDELRDAIMKAVHFYRPRQGYHQ